MFCGFRGPTKYLVADHIVPTRDGGADEPDNLQVLCFWCNSSKGAKATPFQFPFPRIQCGTCGRSDHASRDHPGSLTHEAVQNGYLA